MAVAKKGDAVVIDYTVRTDEGRVVGGTEQGGPQTLVLGEDSLFPELENALVGMEPGEQKKVTVAADNAFGPRDETRIVQIPRSQLAPEPAPQPGMQLSARASDGGEVTLTIVEVGGDSVTADANHPLAGEDLHFTVSLREVKAA